MEDIGGSGTVLGAASEATGTLSAVDAVRAELKAKEVRGDADPCTLLSAPGGQTRPAAEFWRRGGGGGRVWVERPRTG